MAPGNSGARFRQDIGRLFEPTDDEDDEQDEEEEGDKKGGTE
jgi:hypothetical protein